MRGLTCILLLWAFLFVHPVVDAQQMLLVESTRTLKNYKYFPGEVIRFNVSPDKRIIEGVITCLTDSTLCIGDWEEVRYEEILTLYRQRFFMQLFSGFLLTGGVAYFSVDTFNRLINNQSPVVLTETVAISSGLVVLSLGLLPLKYKRINTKNWRIMMLDFDALADH